MCVLVCLCVDVCVCEIVRLNEPSPGGKFHAGAAAILVQTQAGGFLWALEDCVLIKQLIEKCLILQRSQKRVTSHKFAFFALFLNPSLNFYQQFLRLFFRHGLHIVHRVLVYDKVQEILSA